MQDIEDLVKALRTASTAGKEDIKARILALATGENGTRVRDALEHLKRGELLEVQWEIEEVLEAAAPQAAPPAAPAPPPEPPAPENPRQLSMKDLVTVYDDPRGLLLHRTKVGERYFATQMDPYTGQPQTFEIPAQEFNALKTKLAGSPYWVLGANGPAAG